jgi:CII-binding regulator of phage lambda lysogenization HflD
MKNNKYLISMQNKLKFTKSMIKLERSINASSDVEDEVYKKLSSYLKRINKHLASDDIDNHQDYKLYMECKNLISYWD